MARLFIGTPLYSLYLRALGARVGRGVGHPHPARAGLYRPADHRRRAASSRKDTYLSGYRARAGLIETGYVTIGADSFIGEQTVIDIDTALGDGSPARARVRPALRPGWSRRANLARLPGRTRPRRLRTTRSSRLPAAARCAGPGTASTGCCLWSPSPGRWRRAVASLLL